MKKIILLVLISLMFSVGGYCSITTNQYLTPDDVTIANLEANRVTLTDAINSFDGGLINSQSITPDSLSANATPINRWNEAFNDWVFTGLLPPITSGTLTSTTTLGTAYIDGQRVVKDATAKAYTASKWTYLDLSSSGTYTYIEVAIDATPEPTVTSNSIRLARVSTDGSAIIVVRDDRVTGISVGTNEDFTRSGLLISITSPDTVTISPGVLYHGATRLAKTANTSLDLATAGDWATGTTERAIDTFGYVVMDVLGNVKLSTVTPDATDTSGNTDGIHRYSTIAAKEWRAISWFFMNEAGSGKLDHDYGNIRDQGEPNIVMIPQRADITTTSTSLVVMTNMKIKFHSSGRPVLMRFSAPMQHDGTGNVFLSFEVDGAGKGTRTISSPGANNPFLQVIEWRQDLSQGAHAIEVRWKVSAGTARQKGFTDGNGVFIVYEQ